MNDTVQMKKTNLVEILATTEDERLITFLNSFMKGYQEKSEEAPKVKVITTKEEQEHSAAVAKDKIKQAVYTLDGELFEIRRNLNKILFLLQELQEDYFYELDARKDEDQKEILYGYEKNATYTEIIFDNAIEIEKILNKITSSGSNDNE